MAVRFNFSGQILPKQIFWFAILQEKISCWKQIFYIYLYPMIYYGSWPWLIKGSDIHIPNNSVKWVVRAVAQEYQMSSKNCCIEYQMSWKDCCIKSSIASRLCSLKYQKMERVNQSFSLLPTSWIEIRDVQWSYVINNYFKIKKKIILQFHWEHLKI